MNPTTVVIVGAGHAGVQVADALRTRGFDGRIVLIGEEAEPPYHRPPLSKDSLSSTVVEPLPLRSADFYRQYDVELALDTRVTAIDRPGRWVVLADGSRIAYDALVLALGASNRRIDGGEDGPRGVHALRTLEDARRFAAEMEGAGTLGVLGGGLIALEAAAAGRSRGLEVSVVTRSPLMRRVFSPVTSSFVGSAHESAGIRFVAGEARGLSRREGRIGVVLADSSRLTFDLVLMGLGADPVIGLAADAGIEVDTAIVVTEEGRTSDPHVWAAGDCAVVRRPGGSLHRPESVNAAGEQAIAVAHSIMGVRVPPPSVPWFWSIQTPHKLQLAGAPDPSAEAVVRGSVAEGKFSVFLFRGDHLVGIESVNSSADHVAARKILALPARPPRSALQDPAADLMTFARR